MCSVLLQGGDRRLYSNIDVHFEAVHLCWVYTGMFLCSYSALFCSVVPKLDCAEEIKW